jgi:hypothetical protein
MEPDVSTVDQEISGDHMEAAAPVETIDQQPEAGGVEEQASEQVPVSALQAERRERQRLQEEMQLLKNHVELMQMNNQQQQHKEPDPMDQMSDDDVLTVGEAKKYLQSMNQQYQMGIEELKMTQRHPDYQDVVTQYLPEVLKEKPYLRNTLQNDPNRYQIAYDLAKQASGYKNKQHEAKKTQRAEKILKNQNQPGSLSQVGHNTAVQAPSGYKNMSDGDFKALVARNMGLS